MSKVMARFGFYTVVEGIVYCPPWLRFTGRLLDIQKTVCDGQNGCDITWGYVAWMSDGRGRSGFTSLFFGWWLGRCLENSE